MSRRFADGRRVRVKALYPPGHCRTPFYTRGRVGTVLGVADHQPNPEELAYGRDGPARAWPSTVSASRTPSSGRTRRRRSRDAVVVDLFEPWLEPAEGSAA